MRASQALLRSSDGRVGGEVAVGVPEHLMIESKAESNEHQGPHALEMG
jgi:hypothetical protein